MLSGPFSCILEITYDDTTCLACCNPRRGSIWDHCVGCSLPSAQKSDTRHQIEMHPTDQMHGAPPPHPLVALVAVQTASMQHAKYQEMALSRGEVMGKSVMKPRHLPLDHALCCCIVSFKSNNARPASLDCYFPPSEGTRSF